MCAGGVCVTPAVRGADGEVSTATPFTHYAVLGAVYADSPARSKLMYSLGSFTAYLACAYCKLTGTMVGRVVRYLGYAKSVATTMGVGAGKNYQMGGSAQAPERRERLMTESEIKAQAVAAEFYRARGFEPPPGNRLKGYSPVLRNLYWVEPRRLFVVPFCHAFHLGVFKDFMQCVFAKKTRKARPVSVANACSVCMLAWFQPVDTRLDTTGCRSETAVSLRGPDGTLTVHSF